MLPFHRRLAEIGLAAIGEFGFVLAGGYAISGVDADQRGQIVANFASWADELDPERAG